MEVEKSVDETGKTQHVLNVTSLLMELWEARDINNSPVGQSVIAKNSSCLVLFPCKSRTNPSNV